MLGLSNSSYVTYRSRPLAYWQEDRPIKNFRLGLPGPLSGWMGSWIYSLGLLYRPMSLCLTQ